MIYGNKIGGNSVEDKYFVIEMDGIESFAVVDTDDEIPDLTATCKDVKAGQWFVGANGLEQGTNDWPSCRVTSGVHEVYPGVEFMLCIDKYEQWNYTTLHGIITDKKTPYKVEKLIMDYAVYDLEGKKISDITKDPNTCTIRLNLKNETSEIKLLQFFISKEEHNV